MIRAFAAACAVGLVALTLTLGSLRHPTTTVSSLPEPPLSHSVAPPVVIAPPVAASPRHPKRQTRARVTAHRHRAAPTRVALRPTVVVVRPAATTRTEPKRSSAHPRKRPSPKPPSARPSGPAVTTPTTPPPVSPPPPTASPVASPPVPTPTVSTVPTTPPPVVTVTSEEKQKTRPGNGRGDPNHEHTGPPGHSKSHDSD